MSRLNDISLEESVLRSQAANLRDLFHKKAERIAKINALAIFPLKYLQILEVLPKADEPGIGAKLISERIHRSRWGVLDDSKLLAALNLVFSEQVLGPRTGIKPTYLFRLSPWLSEERDLIEAAIHYQSQKKEADVHSTKEQLTFSSRVHPNPEANGNNGNSQTLSLVQLKQLIVKQKPKAQRVLKLFSKKPEHTSSTVAQEENCSQTAAHKPLKQLYDAGLLSRKPASIDAVGRGEYVYFLDEHLTSELIDAVFNQSQQESMLQSESELKDLIAHNGFVNHETLKKIESDSMTTESTQKQPASQSKSQEADKSFVAAIAIINELVAIRRKASLLEDKLSNIAKDIGGTSAEEPIAELIANLRTESF